MCFVNYFLSTEKETCKLTECCDVCFIFTDEEELEFVFLLIYLQIDGYIRSLIIHTSHLLHVTLNHTARSGYEILSP